MYFQCIYHVKNNVISMYFQCILTNSYLQTLFLQKKYIENTLKMHKNTLIIHCIFISCAAVNVFSMYFFFENNVFLDSDKWLKSQCIINVLSMYFQCIY